MLRSTAFAAVLLAAGPALAERAEDLRALSEALRLADTVEVMRAEGLDYGADMQAELFPGRGGPAWDAVVDGIYDPGTMLETVEGALDRALSDDDLGTLVDFFASDRGQRIVELEITAREALIDEGVEEAAEAALAAMRDEDDPRLDLLAEFVEANDLVASNVMGAMNSNYAFYQGLIDGDGLGAGLTERDILADVWAQEDEIRAETETWVYSYLALAYRPLGDDDLEAYIAMSETEPGQRLNRALFAGFDAMYVAISRALGRAAARFMAGEDI